jgi:hypothetical protein
MVEALDTLLLVVILAASLGWLAGHRTARIRHIPVGATAADDAVANALAAACCERWWTSAGAEHDGPCTARWARAVASCPECAVTPGTPCHDNGQPRDDVHDRRIQEAKETRR